MSRRTIRRRPPRTEAVISSAGVTSVVYCDVSIAQKNAAIRQLFVTVNHHQPITADSPAAIRALDQFLTTLSQGWRFKSIEFRGAPFWMTVAMSALADARQHGMHQVRRCQQCGYWMFVRDKRQQYCTTPACVRDRARARMVKKRRHVYEDMRLAREQAARTDVTASRQKKPR